MITSEFKRCKHRCLCTSVCESVFLLRQENSMHLLVGLLTGSNAQCRLQAVRCLHELSHSPHTTMAQACLPATPYLLTYLSGQSTKFTVSTHSYQTVCVILYLMRTFLIFDVFICICIQELCLYTLGNICPDSEAVREKLLAQGIIPALATCIEVLSASFFLLFYIYATQHNIRK